MLGIRISKHEGILRRAIRAITRQKAVVAILIMLFVMLFFDTKFFTSYNLLDMLKSAAIIEIIAFGVTLTILCGGVDFSVGGTMSLSGIIVIKLMSMMPLWSAIVIAVLVGALIGFVNGFFVVQQKTEPFIITLGMGILLKGLGQQLTDAHPISASSMQLMKIANGKTFGSIPNLIIYMIVFFIAIHILLRYTSFGRNCYAIGGDYEVAAYSGINATRIKWTTYILSGVIAAIGGVLLASKLNTASSLYGDTTALTVNCGVVVGGTSFAGGVGGIPQTFVGVLALQMLKNCMNMLGISAYIQQVFEGVLILAIIWSDSFSRKRKREAV